MVPHVMLTVIAAATKQPLQADAAEPYFWAFAAAAVVGLA